ncbi:hypothetical protein [Cellulomonas hominis]|uniref:hypothetical protein n=1 Tax=Cellulomonas hominis TaxID=156981 RepID=UPI001B9324A8|nr:hypothetical protein [Cellulomonas hominis]VTR75664.1 hypothetical protein CHMI_00415 [Cellulomonas hominis]
MTPDDGVRLTRAVEESDVYAARILVRANAKAGRETPAWIMRMAHTPLPYSQPFVVPRRQRRWRWPWPRR